MCRLWSSSRAIAICAKARATGRARARGSRASVRRGGRKNRPRGSAAVFRGEAPRTFYSSARKTFNYNVERWRRAARARPAARLASALTLATPSSLRPRIRASSRCARPPPSPALIVIAFACMMVMIPSWMTAETSLLVDAVEVLHALRASGRTPRRRARQSGRRGGSRRRRSVRHIGVQPARARNPPGGR